MTQLNCSLEHLLSLENNNIKKERNAQNAILVNHFIRTSRNTKLAVTTEAYLGIRKWIHVRMKN